MILENNNSSNKERIAFIENKIKIHGVNSITPDDVIGIEVSDKNGMPSFSDMIYRDEKDDTFIYICLDTNNIKPL